MNVYLGWGDLLLKPYLKDHTLMVTGQLEYHLVAQGMQILQIYVH